MDFSVMVRKWRCLPCCDLRLGGVLMGLLTEFRFGVMFSAASSIVLSIERSGVSW